MLKANEPFSMQRIKPKDFVFTCKGKEKVEGVECVKYDVVMGKDDDAKLFVWYNIKDDVLVKLSAKDGRMEMLLASLYKEGDKAEEEDDEG